MGSGDDKTPPGRTNWASWNEWADGQKPGPKQFEALYQQRPIPPEVEDDGWVTVHPWRVARLLTGPEVRRIRAGSALAGERLSGYLRIKDPVDRNRAGWENAAIWYREVFLTRIEGWAEVAMTPDMAEAAGIITTQDAKEVPPNGVVLVNLGRPAVAATGATSKIRIDSIEDRPDMPAPQIEWKEGDSAVRLGQPTGPVFTHVTVADPPHTVTGAEMRAHRRQSLERTGQIDADVSQLLDLYENDIRAAQDKAKALEIVAHDAVTIARKGVIKEALEGTLLDAVLDDTRKAEKARIIARLQEIAHRSGNAWVPWVGSIMEYAALVAADEDGPLSDQRTYLWNRAIGEAIEFGRKTVTADTVVPAEGMVGRDLSGPVRIADPADTSEAGWDAAIDWLWSAVVPRLSAGSTVTVSGEWMAQRRRMDRAIGAWLESEERRRIVDRLRDMAVEMANAHGNMTACLRNAADRIEAESLGAWDASKVER